VIHVLLTTLGLWLLFLILRSMIRIALMNRHYQDFFAHATGRTVHKTISLCIRKDRGKAALHRVLLWYFPTYILSLIFVYFMGAMVAFLLLYWGAGAVDTWRQGLLASGSALNTLGFATPTTLAGQFLAIPEGALGLGIVVFLFTFIPGYQAVIRSREDMTSWLYVRTGDPPTGMALLGWCQRAGIAPDMRDVWEAWESWFRMIGDTHSVLPMLAMSPSVQSDQSWVTAAAAVLDAAALAVSSMNTPDVEAARVCLRTGTRALLAIAGALGQTSKATGPATARASKAWYDAARTRLYSIGLPLKPAVDAEPQWGEFQALRGEYQEALSFVARQTFAAMEEDLIDMQSEAAIQI
jgi:hypothetical protein